MTKEKIECTVCKRMMSPDYYRRHIGSEQCAKNIKKDVGKRCAKIMLRFETRVRCKSLVKENSDYCGVHTPEVLQDRKENRLKHNAAKKREKHERLIRYGMRHATVDQLVNALVVREVGRNETMYRCSDEDCNTRWHSEDHNCDYCNCRMREYSVFIIENVKDS